MAVETVSVTRVFDMPQPAGCPFFVTGAILAADRWGRSRSVSGRGQTREEARSRCLAEAVERLSAVHDERRPLRRAAFADVAKTAVDPRQLILVSDAQYANREEWNRKVPLDHRLPDVFEARRPIDWVEAKTLAEGESVFVPAACCYLGFPDALGQGFAVPDSSGLAAGATFDDAVAHALLELVERDAVAVWWYNELPRPPLRLDGDQPVLRAFQSWMEARGRRFWLLDLTHDLGIAVAAAISCDSAGCDLSFGFAAGWSADQAGLAAMGELVQFEATKELVSQPLCRDPPDLITYSRTTSVHESDFLSPRPDAPHQPASTRDLKTAIRSMSRKALQPLVVDLSRHQHRVVRVLVPGLRAIWPRYAPGRLFEVPRALGWSNHETVECALNPAPILY